jgi:hypothetical protein
MRWRFQKFTAYALASGTSAHECLGGPCPVRLSGGSSRATEHQTLARTKYTTKP